MAKKKKPAPPPPPREMHVSVWGNGQLVADKVSFSTLTPEPAPYNVPLDVVPYQDPGGPRLKIRLPTDVPYGWGSHLIIDVPGYQRYQERVAISPDLDVTLTPAQADPVVLPRLVPAGSCFVRADGSRFTAIDATDFSLYAKYMEGLDITPVLRQRRDVGFNMVRIFGVTQNVWPTYTCNLTPARYGDAYYQRLAPFHQLLANHGLYSDWVAFISNNEIPTLDAQVQHWDRLTAHLQLIPNVIVSLINEDSAHPSLLCLNKVAPRVGVVSSHGSNGGAPGGANGLPPPEPKWDWHELHCNDAFEWVRKVGHNTWEQDPNKPGVATENTRAPDRFQSTNYAFDAAAGASLLCAGSTFHSVSGRASDLWTGLELDLAKAWVAGAKSVPLSCQGLPYQHGPAEMAEESSGGYLRVYQRGADPACRVRIRR